MRVLHVAAMPRPPVKPVAIVRTFAALVGGVMATGGVLALGSALYARRLERRIPADGSTIEIDGTRLHYVDFGANDAPAIVMIHGLGGQLRNFTYALAGRLAADHRVIAIDRPGSGHSIGAPGADWGLLAQARLVGALIDRLGLARPLVVGHSLGGAVALATALERPDAVGGLALLCPLTQPLAGVPPMFRPLFVRSAWRRRLIARLLAVPLGLLGQGRARRAIFAPDPVPAGFAIRGGGALALRPSAFAAASAEVSRGSGELRRMAARYGTLRLPVGILYASGDEVLSPALHGERTAAAIPHATIEFAPGGHMLPLTAPDRCAAFLRKQAARIEPARR